MAMRQIVFPVFLTVLISSATSVYAQGPISGRPYRGLFGGNRGATWDQSLTFHAGLGIGHDWGLVVGIPTAPDVLATEQLDGSGFQEGSAGLEYSLNRSRGELRAGFDGSASHYPTLSRSTFPVYRAAVDGSVQLWSDARLRGGYQMIYGPFYELAWSSEEYRWAADRAARLLRAGTQCVRGSHTLQRAGRLPTESDTSTECLGWLRLLQEPVSRDHQSTGRKHGSSQRQLHVGPRAERTGRLHHVDASLWIGGYGYVSGRPLRRGTRRQPRICSGPAERVVQCGSFRSPKRHANTIPRDWECHLVARFRTDLASSVDVRPWVHIRRIIWSPGFVR